MVAERLERSQSRKAAERKRMKDATKLRIKAEGRRSGMVTIQVGKTRQTVRKVTTMVDKVFKAGNLPKELKLSIDAFAILVADGMGVATEDGDDSTSKLIGTYDGYVSGSGFKSGGLSDRQLEGLTAFRVMRSQVPVELQDVFLQIVYEEVGLRHGLAKTLAEWGEEFGYRYKQSSSAGSMMVFCVAALVAHYLRNRGISVV